MMKKILLAAAGAGLIATGSLAVASPAAAATAGSVSVSFRGPNFAISIGHPVVYPKPYRVCKPVYKKVYYTYRGKTYSKLVRTGYTCHWVYPQPTYPRYPVYPYRPY